MSDKIVKRGDSWYYCFVVGGERYKGVIGNVTKTDAKDAAMKEYRKVIEGQVCDRPRKSPLLGLYDAATKQYTGIAGEYLKQYGDKHRASSTERLEYALQPLTAAFGDKRLDQIAPFAIERYMMERKATGKAGATVNRELACLKSLFTTAMAWGRATINPVKQVKLYKLDNGRIRYLTNEEELGLLKQCSLKLRTLILAAADTGFRAGELQSLKWSDVSIKNNTITVQGDNAKNGETRTNPMTTRLSLALQTWMATTNGKDADLVFGRYSYRTAFENARSKAGLGKDVVFHSLRHTYISRLAMAGVDIRTVQELAGHKSIVMTMRYAHLAPQHKQKAITLLENEVTPNLTPLALAHP